MSFDRCFEFSLFLLDVRSRSRYIFHQIDRTVVLCSMLSLLLKIMTRRSSSSDVLSVLCNGSCDRASASQILTPAR